MAKKFTTSWLWFLVFASASPLALSTSAKADKPSKETRKLERAYRRALKARKKIETISLGAGKNNYSAVLKRRKKKTPPFDLLPEHLPAIKVKSEARIVYVHQIVLRGQQILRSTPAAFPVKGRISSVFGPRRHPKSQDYRLHSGIDIVARLGAPVVATAEGKVVFSGVREGYGKVVVLDHGFGYQTVYAHNSRISAPLGARIGRGQVIAYVGASGHTTGPHLHYEVRKNGLPVDPAPFLRPQAAKL